MDYDKKGGSVLVCVTDQRRCEKLIEFGHSRAMSTGCSLIVLSIQPAIKKAVGLGEAMENMFKISSRLSAQMYIYYNNDLQRTFKSFMNRHIIKEIIIGMSDSDNDSGFRSFLESNHGDLPLTVFEHSQSAEGKIQLKLAVVL